MQLFLFSTSTGTELMELVKFVLLMHSMSARVGPMFKQSHKSKLIRCQMSCVNDFKRRLTLKFVNLPCD